MNKYIIILIMSLALLGGSFAGGYFLRWNQDSAKHNTDLAEAKLEAYRDGVKSVKVQTQIEERTEKEVQVVQAKPDTNTCGPAVDASIDSLREHRSSK